MKKNNATKTILNKLVTAKLSRLDSKRKQRRFLVTDASVEQLELRKLLATFQYSSGHLTITTNTDNELLSIYATTDNGNYTIQTSGTFTGSNITGNLVGNTTNTLTVYDSLVLSNIAFSDGSANVGASFYFGNSTGNFTTNLSVNYQNASSGMITIANDTLLINSANLSLATAGNSITQSNMISTNGSGAVSFTARNINISGNITTESGNISLVANPDALETDDFDGVSISSATIGTTGGNILIQGRNGNGVGCSTGVYLSSAFISTLANGSISVIGNTSNNPAISQYGIDLESTNLSTENGSVSLIGVSSGETTFDIGLYSSFSAISITGNGSIILDGTGGTGNANGEMGVYLNSTGLSSGSGNISIVGASRGVDQGKEDYGVFIYSGSLVSMLEAGTISINGTSGSGNGGYEVGVGITSSQVHVNNGSISIIGHSNGTASGHDDYGISLHTGTVTLSGTGTITLNGTSGNGTGGNEIGVRIESSTIENTNGTISITGISDGPSDSDSGVQLLYDTTTTPAITVYSADNISITGVTANPSAFGVNLSNAVVSSNGGQISLLANAVYVDADTQVNATTAGTVAIRTLGTGVVLGDENSAANLGLTQAALDRITAGTLTLGDANAPNILVNQSISWGNNLSLSTAGDITQASANSLTVSGHANFTAGQSILLDQNTNNFTSLSAQAVNITIIDQDDLQLASVNATGFLVVNATTGNISQSTAGILVQGYSCLTATAGCITLDAASGNDFVGNITGSANTIQIRNTNATLLGVISATDLTVNSTGGAITQASGANLSISGTANFVTSASGASGNITLNNATNNFGTVTASGTNITLNETDDITIGAITASGDFKVQGDNTTSCISVTGPVDATGGSGNVTQTGRNIVVSGNIVTAAGDITLYGNGGGSYQTGTFDGVCISGSTVNVNTTIGNITIDGRGGLNTVKAGVNLTSSKVQAGGSGCVTIRGVSGNGTSNAFGIFASGANVTTNSGSIYFNGTSCGTNTSGKGVFLNSSAKISSTATGNVTITGNVANGTGYTYGVFARGNSCVTTNSGSVTIDGKTNGSQSCSTGVFLYESSNISATVAGNVTITGTAANGTSNARGIYFAQNVTVTTSSGSLAVNGTSCGTQSGSTGVYLWSFTNISATGAGNVTITGSTPRNLSGDVGINSGHAGSKIYSNGALITLTANSLSLVGTVNATTAGNVLIQTLGAGVNLGGADDSANLGLTNAKIGKITADLITIGNSSTGAITNTDAISRTGNLKLVSGNTISQSGSGNLVITGTANFISNGIGIDGNITLNNATNDFGTFMACGTNITVTDATGIEFGVLNATGDLLANGLTGAITQAVGTRLSITGTANFISSGTGTNGNITLNNTTNDFGTFTASGTNIMVTDATGIQFGMLTATSDLTANGVSGAITQAAGTNLSVGGTANFVTGDTGSAGNVTLNNVANDFGTVMASGTNITLADTNALTLGDITGDGTVQITAQNLTITSTVSASSSGSVILLPTSSTVIDLGTKSTGNFGLTQAELDNITAGTLIIGDTNSGAILNTAAISRSNATLGTNLNLVSGASISQSGAGNLTISGTGNFVSGGTGNSGNITLSNATNDFNIVTASGTNITIVDLNDLALDSISGNGTIQIETPNLTINSSVNATSSGTVVLLPLADAIVDLGTKSSGKFSLTQTELNQITAETLVIGNATSNAIINTDAISWSGNLTLVSGNTISQSGGNLTIGGTGNFVAAGDVMLGDPANNFTFVTASGTSITINDVDNLTVGNITGSVDIFITSSDLIIQGTVNATTSGGVNLLPNAGIDIDLGTKSANNFGLTNAEINRVIAGTLNIGNPFDTGNIAITSNIVPVGFNSFNLFSNGDISETGAGKLVIASDFAAFASGNVTLGNSTNQFSGLIGVTANSADLVNNAPSLIDSIVTTGSFTFSSTGGNITQSGTGVGAGFSVGGNTSLIATGYAITLDTNTSNNFVGSVSANGNDISITDADAIELGLITGTGNLTVTALANTITQTSSGVSVAGWTSLTATGNAITLNTATNNHFVGNISATGSSVDIRNSNATLLGTISASDLTVNSTGGAITQTSGGISVSGNTNITVTGNGITLNTATNNDFVGNISASGTVISIRNNNATLLGTISATDMTVDSTGGPITQTSDGISASGNTSLTASGNAITVDNSGNNFNSGNISACGTSVSIRNANATLLGTISATDLTVNATAGAISQAAVATVSNNSTLIAAGNAITLNQAGSSFGNLTTNGNLGFSNGGAATLSLVGGNATISGSASVSGLTTAGVDLNQTGGTLNGLKVTGGTSNISGGSFNGNANVLTGGAFISNISLGSLSVNGGTANLAASANVTGITVINNGTLTNSGRFSGTYTQNNGTANMQTGAVITGLATLAGGSLTSNAAFNGGLTATGGTLYTLHNGTTTTNLNFGAASVWNANGSSLTDFGQISANGSVTIASGANLTLVVPPMLCGQSITVINKTGSGAISGSFSGLSQGTFFTSNGMPLAISYTAGSGGNDLVVTDTPRIMVIVGGNNQTAASGALFGSNLTVQIMGGAANETPVVGANVLFQLPVQVANCNIASGYFNSVNNVANLTANVVTDNNGNATIAIHGGVNPGPFNIQPVMSDYRSLYNTFNLGVVGLAVQKQSINRSNVRYLDLVLSDPTSIPDLTALNSNVVLQKVKSASLTGGANITPVNLTLSATNAVKTTVGWMFDFGTAGIGGNGAETITDDGVYQFANATSPSVGLPSTYQFHRLLGDTNGDKVVDAADTTLVNSLTSSLAWRYNNANTSLSQGSLFYVASNTWAGDANGDGRVNATDINITGRWRGRRVTY